MKHLRLYSLLLMAVVLSGILFFVRARSQSKVPHAPATPPAFTPLNTLTEAEKKALNTLTEAEKEAGWKLLFDGKTTAGWRNYLEPRISPGWKVIDGALTRAEFGASDIVTVDQYDSFELSLEYCISPGGNSGVMYHVTEFQGAAPVSGPEVQIDDITRRRDPQLAGWLYDLYSSEVNATKPAGEWNRLRIIVSPEKCETYMNGEKYYEYVIGSDDWNARVAKSKFARYAGFGKATSGYIALQDHDAWVAFRNIKIRPLPPRGEAQESQGK